MGKAIGRLAGALSLGWAGAVAAQVTPEQVWTSFQDSYGDFGIALTGTTTTEGSDLRITGMLGEVVLPQGFGTIRMDLPDIALVDNGDGTVGVVYPETFTATVTADVGAGFDRIAASVDLTLVMKDAVLTVSGQPDDMTYRTIAALYDVVIDNLQMIEPSAMTGTEIFVAFTVEDTDTTTRVVTTDAGTTSDITSTAARTVFDIGITPEFGGDTRTVGVVGLTTTAGTITIPAGPLDVMNLAAALRSGLAIDMTTTSVDQINQNVVYLFDELISDQSQTVAETRQVLTLTQDGMSITSSGSGIVLDIGQDEFLPVPILVTVDNADVRVAFPVSANSAPQGFELGMNLTGLTISDEVTGLFDPTGSLQNTPVTFGMMLTGQTTLEFDLFDFNAMMDPTFADRFTGGKPPIALNALTLDRLVVDGFGVAMDGSGSFAIDNTDTVTFDGLPKPTGTATFNLTGAQAMIDTLLKLGVIRSEDAMGARMGLGMIGRATGDDTMTSTIEVNAAGHVIVNGQRMQ